MYAIVDIETTGGNAVFNKIIEIAVFIFDGEKVVDEYQTLVNPERQIPGHISAFTGISNDLVINAPRFSEVAQRIEEMTEDKIFVAHNVNFDYSFIKKEFYEIGKQWRRKKLCTVRLSRNIIPGMPSYGLGSICSDLGIKIYGRHRAGGDASATVKLLAELIKRDQDNFIEYSLNRTSREALLPPNLPREQFENLPEEMGVYYFHDEKEKVVYVGKAKSIIDRVSTHFSGNTNTNRKQMFLNTIHRVSHQLCGNELIALLFESNEIKKYWPKFNRAQKRVGFNYGLYQYEDRNRYRRLSIARVNKSEASVLTFKYLNEARSFMAGKVREFDLCPKLCGLQKSARECFDYPMDVCKGACCGKETPEDYNQRFQQALDSMGHEGKSFVIIGQGREFSESSVVLVENGTFQGFGFLDNEIEINNPEEFKSYIDNYPDNPDIQNILAGHLRRNTSDKVIQL